MGVAAGVLSSERAASRTQARAPIDRVHLARFTLGNLDLEIEILGLFAMQAPDTLRQLKAALTEKAWRDAAHTLKGSARAVGAKSVGDCAERAEALVGPENACDRPAAIAALAAELDDAIAYIERLSRPE